MTMVKFGKILFSLFLFFTLFFGAGRIFAQNSATIYFFWGDGCPHCEKEKVFLGELKIKYPQIVLRNFEVWKNAENRQFLIDFGNKLNVEIVGVPFTVVGDKYFSGWYDKESTGKAIESAVDKALNEGCRNLGSEIIGLEEKPQENNGSCDGAGEKDEIPENINVPFLGQISIKNFSLPLITIILGALDGFNPCAMWTLIFLISLLLGMKNRRRMWILGIAFVAASSFVYFIFMSAWLNLILFIGFILWVRLGVGLVSLVGGVYGIKEYFANPKAVCTVAGDEKKQKVFEKLKAIVKRDNFYLALGGIILLAFAVNLVELICSAGLPVIFTQILALSGLSWWQYYLYIMLYVAVFMADDLFVFFTAMVTLKMAGITTKYARLSRLIGGVLMLVIGILLIFRPEWLMFG